MIHKKRIRYFLTVCEEGNISMAARKLYVSQPSLSYLITEIEQELGTDLFIRDRNGVTLTKAGEIYRNTCLRIQNVCSDMQREINDLIGRETEKLVLGFGSATGEVIIPEILDRFRKIYPLAEISLAEGHARELPELIRKGVVDIALCYSKKDPDLIYKPVLTEKIYLAVPDYFCAARDGYRTGFVNPPVGSEKLRNQQFILLKRGRGIREISDFIFEKYMITPKVILETNSVDLSYSMTLKNEGFSFFPSIVAKYLAKTMETGVFAEFQDEPLERTLCVCYRKDLYFSRAISSMIEIITDVMKSYEAV